MIGDLVKYETYRQGQAEVLAPLLSLRFLAIFRPLWLKSIS